MSDADAAAQPPAAGAAAVAPEAAAAEATAAVPPPAPPPPPPAPAADEGLAWVRDGDAELASALLLPRGEGGTPRAPPPPAAAPAAAAAAPTQPPAAPEAAAPAPAAGTPGALRCANSNHAPTCRRCTPPPSDQDIDLYCLVGDVGAKNGEKKLRAQLTSRPEWLDNEQRAQLAAACEASPELAPGLAEALRTRNVSALRKRHLFFLARMYGLKSDIWQRKTAAGGHVANGGGGGDEARGFDGSGDGGNGGVAPREPAAKRQRRATTVAADAGEGQGEGEGGGGGGGAARPARARAAAAAPRRAPQQQQQQPPLSAVPLPPMLQLPLPPLHRTGPGLPQMPQHPLGGGSGRNAGAASVCDAAACAPQLTRAAVTAYLEHTLRPMARAACETLAGRGAAAVAAAHGAPHITRAGISLSMRASGVCAALANAFVSDRSALLSALSALRAERAAAAAGGAATSMSAVAPAWRHLLGAPSPAHKVISTLAQVVAVGLASNDADKATLLRLHGAGALGPADVAWFDEIERAMLCAMELAARLECLLSQLRFVELGLFLELSASVVDVAIEFASGAGAAHSTRAAWMAGVVESRRAAAAAAGAADVADAAEAAAAAAAAAAYGARSFSTLLAEALPAEAPALLTGQQPPGSHVPR